MKLKVFTLRMDPATGKFDDRELTDAARPSADAPRKRIYDELRHPRLLRDGRQERRLHPQEGIGSGNE